MPTSIRLPDEIEQRLSFLAKETGRTKAFYLREIIETGLSNIEDIYLAETVSLRVKEDKETTCSLDELEQKIALES